MAAKEMSTNRKMDKQIVIHIHKREYYSPVEGNELLKKAIHQMNFKAIQLHKRSQIHKGYTYDSQYVNFKDKENKSVVIEVRINDCLCVGRATAWSDA